MLEGDIPVELVTTSDTEYFTAVFNFCFREIKLCMG